jgi:hypothetical protein
MLIEFTQPDKQCHDVKTAATISPNGFSGFSETTTDSYTRVRTARPMRESVKFPVSVQSTIDFRCPNDQVCKDRNDRSETLEYRGRMAEHSRIRCQL